LLAAVRGLYSNSVRSGLEIKVPIPGESRPGRLDVVALHEHSLICFEAKTSLSEAIKDRRFIEQVPKYRKEIKSALAAAGLANTDPLIFLAAGGSESDLKAKDYKLNPSAVGKKLLEVCDSHQIKFVTANSIWQLLAIRLIAPERALELDQVLKTLEVTESFLGLTSAGYVTHDEQIVAPLS
jgi:Holliday junction resolvase